MDEYIQLKENSGEEAGVGKQCLPPPHWGTSIFADKKRKTKGWQLRRDGQ